KLNEVEATSAKIVDETSYAFILDHQPITFVGNGAEKCSGVIQHHHARFLTTNFNSAAHMSILADKAFAEQSFEDVAYFEPFYLKDFVFTTPKARVI
ncbi:MAG: tRNA threonylcarbamoyladenosine biosynthesis protein TsaB, partial [Bacteroidia bacterium]